MNHILDQEKFKRICPNYNYIPVINKQKSRIVAIGDLHGDYQLMIDILKLARVIDNNNNWIGSDTYIVQVGDQIDRCRPRLYGCHDPRETVDDENSDIKILEYMTDLHNKAIKSGGAVISLLGNHELMNSTNNLNYVSYQNLLNYDKNIEEAKRLRYEDFMPTGNMGKKLGCTRLSLVIIGDYLFVHGGVIKSFINNFHIKNRDDFVKINNLIRDWLVTGKEIKKEKDLLYASDSIFWERTLGKTPVGLDEKDDKCKKINEVLDMYDLGGMIIGHTPQIHNNQLVGINTTCSNKLIRVDYGGSKAFNVFDLNGNLTRMRLVQALEITKDGVVNILSNK